MNLPEKIIKLNIEGIKFIFIHLTDNISDRVRSNFSHIDD